MRKNMSQKAIESVQAMIRQVEYESPDDEGAAEWEGHLMDVLRMLQNGTMTAEEAQDSLGVSLYA